MEKGYVSIAIMFFSFAIQKNPKRLMERHEARVFPWIFPSAAEVSAVLDELLKPQGVPHSRTVSVQLMFVYPIGTRQVSEGEGSKPMIICFIIIPMPIEW